MLKKQLHRLRPAKVPSRAKKQLQRPRPVRKASRTPSCPSGLSHGDVVALALNQVAEEERAIIEDCSGIVISGEEEHDKKLGKKRVKMFSEATEFAWI